MTKDGLRNRQLWWERLTQAGCALDLDENCTIASNQPALQITQRGHPLMENVVAEMPSGLTEYVLGVRLVRLAARIYLEGYDLVVPWADSQILWLPDFEQGGPSKMNFVMPESRDVHPVENVINHYIGTELKLGQRLEGLVLASSTTVLPANIKHGSFAAVKFSVVDQYGQVYSEDFRLYVNRSRGPKMQRTTKHHGTRPPVEENEVRQPPSVRCGPEKENAGSGRR